MTGPGANGQVPLLEAREITVRFGGVVAVTSVTIRVSASPPTSPLSGISSAVYVRNNARSERVSIVSAVALVATCAAISPITPISVARCAGSVTSTRLDRRPIPLVLLIESDGRSLIVGPAGDPPPVVNLEARLVSDELAAESPEFWRNKPTP